MSVSFLASVMYLIQARRLRRKVAPGSVVPMLSLERLETMNRRALNLAFPMLTAGLLVGTVAGLVSNNARFYLIEGAVPSLVFALACLVSLRFSKPLIYRLAVEVLGPDPPKGREAVGAWRYPSFRRAFRIITAAWGIAYLFEVAVRLVVVAITSTGIALLFSKLIPYAFAIVLSLWTFGYGEHERRKAERLAAAAEDPAVPPAVAADTERHG